MAKYEIESATEKAKKFPDTFMIPTYALEGLRPGSIVKLVFASPGCPKERMWVKIVDVKGKRFVGALDNDPLCVPFEPGKLVTFGAEDIVDIYPEDATATVLWFLFGAAALGFMGWAIYRSIAPAVVVTPPALPPPATP